MSPYRDSTLAHLAEYKRTCLGVTAHGVWPHDGKAYSNNRYAILLLPRANDALIHSTKRFLAAFVEDAVRAWVKIVFLEDFLDAMLGLSPELDAHFREVRAKYVVN